MYDNPDGNIRGPKQWARSRLAVPLKVHGNSYRFVRTRLEQRSGILGSHLLFVVQFSMMLYQASVANSPNQ